MKNDVYTSMKRERMSTTALSVPRSIREHNQPIVLRGNPGVMVPIAAGGLLREDAIARGRLAVQIQMDETAEVLINPVSVRVSLWLVPWLAFERFSGRDEFEASYAGKPLLPGGQTVPFIETIPRGLEGDHPILDALGRPGAATDDISTMYIEAYNAIVNYRYANLSSDLQLRARLEDALAPAIRERGRHRQMVPSFDQSAMDGGVDIDVENAGSLPLKGVGLWPSTDDAPGANVYESGSAGTVPYTRAGTVGEGRPNAAYFELDPSGRPVARVEFDDLEMRFSLAAIDRARKTQAFAELRKRFNAHDDDDLIDMLMNGIRMPEKMFEQPIHLGSRSAGFGFQKRYATDSANLDQTVVEGGSMVSMEFATPRIGTGGVIMAIAEIQPEALFEREQDPFLFTTNVDHYPQFVRDELDEQKVDLVKNRQIDTAHTDPDGTFGYEPLNHRWNVRTPAIGTGLLALQPVTTFSEDRARIWDNTPTDPALGTDWYLTSDMPLDVFEYTSANRPPFEISGRIQMAITGNTVFGPPLVESEGDYDAVDLMAPAPEDQIDQTV